MSRVQFVRRDKDRSVYIVRVGQHSGRVDLMLSGAIVVHKNSGLPKRSACKALEEFISNQVSAVLTDRRLFTALVQGA